MKKMMLILTLLISTVTFAEGKDLFCSKEHISGDKLNTELRYTGFRIKNFDIHNLDKVIEIQYIKTALPDYPTLINDTSSVILDESKVKIVGTFKLRFLQTINAHSYYRIGRKGQMLLIANNPQTQIETLSIEVATSLNGTARSGSNTCFMVN